MKTSENRVTNIEKRVIDVTGLSSDQIAMLEEIVAALKAASQTNNYQGKVTLDRLEETPQPSLTLEQRRAFLQLTLEERRRLLAQQAENMVEYYQENTEWQEFLAGDIIEY